MTSWPSGYTIKIQRGQASLSQNSSPFHLWSSGSRFTRGHQSHSPSCWQKRRQPWSFNPSGEPIWFGVILRFKNCVSGRRNCTRKSIFARESKFSGPNKSRKWNAKWRMIRRLQPRLHYLNPCYSLFPSELHWRHWRKMSKSCFLYCYLTTRLDTCEYGIFWA